MSNTPVDCLYTDARIATMTAGSPYGLIDNGAVGVTGERCAWVGAARDAPTARRTERCGGRLLTPALIDCHTHLVYAGDRTAEFESRLNGASYADIARAGGGIRATVEETRAATEDDLVAQALPRIDALMAEGLGTIEIKSGYGLDIDTELKMLRAAKSLGRMRDVRVTTTFLGAHALPPEFAGRPAEYVDFVCEEALPAAHAEQLVDAVDAFCETIGFSTELVGRVFATAKQLGLPVKLHAGQLSDIGAAELALAYDALSVDHLEYVNERDIERLGASTTVAVLLPGAYYFLRESRKPPVDRLRAAGVPMALATDCNPGSSPLTSLLLAMNLGCTLFLLTPEEALAGCTSIAAKALGCDADRGTLEPGKLADIAVWNAEKPAELAYRMGFNPLYKRIFAGSGPC